VAQKRTLRIASSLGLPLEVATRATGVVGQRGTGKTSTGVVFVEEAHACGAQFAVIDPTGAWWGLRSSSDGQGEGLPVVVFGGDHADVPLEAEHGPLIADLVVKEGYRPVLDLNLLTKSAQVRFVAEFMESLYHQNREALLVVVDEAHRFAPQQLRQGEQGGFGARCLGAVTDVVTLGRRKGLGAVVISQRPAKINKDVFEQVELVVAHRLMGPNDRKQIAGWLEEADEEAAALAKSALVDLRKLPNGEALVYAPDLPGGQVYGRYRIREKRTFDSSKTPEIGVKVAEPKARAEVDMAALEARLADVIEKQKEEDPRELRRRLRAAEGKAGTAQARVAIAEGERQGLEEELAALRAELEQRPSETVELTDLDREVLQSAVAELREALEPFAGAGRVAVKRERPPTVAEPPTRPKTPAPVPRAGVAAAPDQNGEPEVKLKAGARRMASALARLHPTPLTRNQVATLGDISPKSGTFTDYLASLRRAGLIADVDGGRVALTEAGVAEYGDLLGRGAPTPQELAAMWLPKFKAGARRMLEELMEVYPDGLTRDEIAERAGITRSSGTFTDYLASLRRNGLLDESEPGLVRAGPALFIGAS
jgi:hypothetical protein